MKKTYLLTLLLAFAVNAAHAQDSQDVVLMGGSGTHQDVSTCNAMFYDEGGPDKNYPNSGKTATVTFHPGKKSNKIKAHFEELNTTKFGYGDAYDDLLTVYSGTKVEADKLLGKFSGNYNQQLPDDIVSASGDGALTFQFNKGVMEASSGWKIHITCEESDELMVSKLIPEDEAQHIEINQTIGVVFSKEFEIQDLSGVSISPAVDDVYCNVVDDTLKIQHALLQEATTYTVTVPAGAVKGYDEAVSWSFTTKRCSFALPFNYGFEDDDAVSFSCWTVLNPSENQIGISGNLAESGKQSFMFCSSNSTSEQGQYLITPMLPAAEGYKKVSFGYASEETFNDYEETFRVGYSSTGKELSDFTWLDAQQIPLENCGTFYKYETVVPENTKYVAVHNMSVNQNRFYIDDFSIDAYSPEVEQVTPARDAADIELNTPIQIAFTQSIDVKGNDFSKIKITPEIESVSAELSGNVLSIKHGILDYGTTYTVTLPANSLYGLESDYSWSFTTKQRPAEQLDIVSKEPEDGSGKDIYVDGKFINVKFNQTVIPADLSKITLSPSVTGMSAQVKDDSLLISHDDFELGETYIVTIPAGTLKYQEKDFTWQFTPLSVRMQPRKHLTYSVDKAMFYDDGGKESNYSGKFKTGEDPTVVTFKPKKPGMLVKAKFLNFQTFFYEDSRPLCDILYVYNGAEVNEKRLIDEFTGDYNAHGSTMPADIISTDADGALTFRFYSLGLMGTMPGFEIEISCVDPVVVPSTIMPKLDATGVKADDEVSVLFTMPFELTDASGITIQPNPGNMKITAEGKLLTLAHADFAPETKYTVTIPANSVKGCEDAITWSFTTAEQPEEHTIASPYQMGFEDVNYELSFWSWLQQSANSNNDLKVITNDMEQSFDGRNYWKFSSANTNADGQYDQYLITPRLPFTGEVSMAMYYAAFSYNKGTEKFRTGYSTTTKDRAAFTWNDFEEVEQDGTGINYFRYTKNFPAGTRYIAINYTDTQNSEQLFVDNIVLTEKPVSGITAVGGDTWSVSLNASGRSITVKAQNAKVAIFDTAGRTIKAFRVDGTQTVSLTEAPGVYFVSVTADGKKQVKKLMVR